MWSAILLSLSEVPSWQTYWACNCLSCIYLLWCLKCFQIFAFKTAFKTDCHAESWFFPPIYFFAVGYTHVEVADSFWELVFLLLCGFCRLNLVNGPFLPQIQCKHPESGEFCDSSDCVLLWRWHFVALLPVCCLLQFFHHLFQNVPYNVRRIL